MSIPLTLPDHLLPEQREALEEEGINVNDLRAETIARLGVKAQVQVRPYLREGHPVEGYARIYQEIRRGAFKNGYFDPADEFVFRADTPMTRDDGKPYWKALISPDGRQAYIWTLDTNAEPSHISVASELHRVGAFGDDDQTERISGVGSSHDFFDGPATEGGWIAFERTNVRTKAQEKALRRLLDRHYPEMVKASRGKAQIHVRPYIREGHPVVGYMREEDLVPHPVIGHSIREFIDLPKSGKLREHGERALAAIDKVLTLPEMPRIPVRATAGKNSRGGFIRDQIGDIEVEKWDGPTVRLANMRPANRPAKRADEFEPGDIVLMSGGWKKMVMEVRDEPAPGPFGRPKEDGSTVRILAVQSVEGESNTPSGEEYEEKHKPDELLAFPWEPEISGQSRFAPKEIRASATPLIENKEGAPAPWTPDETLVHEIGHFIDNAALIHSPDGHDMASLIAAFKALPAEERDQYPAKAREKGKDDVAATFERWLAEPDELEPWYRAVMNTHAVKELQTPESMMDAGTHQYLLKATELFARSFAQWIAMRSGDPTMVEEIRAWQNLPLKYTGHVENWKGDKLPYERDMPKRLLHQQWQDADFAPVAFELDRLFERLSWLKPTAVGVTVG